MCTTCKFAIQDVTHERLKEPETAVFLVDLVKQMNGNCYNHQYLELAIGADWQTGRYTIYDAYAFSIFLDWFWTGRILTCQVYPTAEKKIPWPDRCRDENNLILSTLSRPFRGTFVGGAGAGGDGRIEWTDPIKLERTIDHRDGRIEKSLVDRAPGSVTLEVGTVNNYNTLHHLRWRGGLARWPYDCPYVTILLVDGALDEIDGDGPLGPEPAAPTDALADP